MLSRCFFQSITVLLLVIPTVLSTPLLASSRLIDHDLWFLDPARFEVLKSGNVDHYSGEELREEPMEEPGEGPRTYNYEYETSAWIDDMHPREHSSTSDQIQVQNPHPQAGIAKIVKFVLHFKGKDPRFDWTGINFQSSIHASQSFGYTNKVSLYRCLGRAFDADTEHGPTLTFYSFALQDLAALPKFRIVVRFYMIRQLYDSQDFSVSYEILQSTEGLRHNKANYNFYWID